MNILGLNFGATSSCAIFKNDEIVFASSEERFSRIKSDESYPYNAIEKGLEFLDMNPSDLDQILISGNEIPINYILLRFYSSFSIEDHLKSMNEFWKKKLSGEDHETFLKIFENKANHEVYPFNQLSKKFSNLLNEEHDNYSIENKDKISEFFKEAIANQLSVDKKIISHIDHHTGHAAYAFYGSPIREDNTLILTADAHGDGLSASISIYNKSQKKINRVKKYSVSDFQLGRIYRYTTLLLKMLPDEHEYKVMGLAAYYDGPKIQEVKKIFEKMQEINGLEFKFNSSIKNIYEYLKNNLVSFRFDHIASGLQLFTEEIITTWINNAIKEFNCKTVVFSGGISMNVKANMKINEIPEIEKMFVCGGGGDSSLSIGSCYAYAESNGISSKPLKDMYLGIGCSYSLNEIKKLSTKYNITKFSSSKQIVDRLLEGKIIATCFGRAEMGPRALGNRSIIADPRKRENIEKINRKIKNRDFWMPFAPVILQEFQNEILKNPKDTPSPHMTIGFDTIEGKERIPVGVHQYDGTARPLILKKNTNERLWEVIKEFYDHTKIPALVNTSFNLHGEPMVNSFNDALHVFERSGLDSIWFDNHIIDKK
jgi:carbamoyltransferase